ncbi:MAG: hypothetical protein DCF16_02135 [Alphaproteobacteria bacterium]|nr:MAG: hypothetical protein DCF16_02135 [Alphaproteobacteria bacterium]
MIVVALIVLWFFPRWAVLAILAVALAILNSAINFFVGRDDEIVGDLLVNIPVFALIGWAIVEWHARKRERTRSQDLDKEMERVRAEIAAREADPPGAN